MLYFFKKLKNMILSIFLISLFLFLFLQIIPSDPVLSRLGAEGIEQNPELAQRYTKEFNLDKPAYARYFLWASGVIKGDLGNSFTYPTYSVNELITDRVPTTLTLALMSLSIILIFGISLGIYLTKVNSTRNGALCNAIAQILISIPSFILGIILLSIFGIKLRMFPLRGGLESSMFGTIKSLTLPTLTLSIGGIINVARYLKSSLLEESERDYVLVAKSKGLLDNEVLKTHIFRNSLIPLVTIGGLTFITLMTGSIIVENIFSISGLGRLLITSIVNNDYPLIMGIVFYYSVISLFIMFVLDIIYGFIDPRIKVGG